MNPEMRQLRDKLKGLKLDGMIVSNPINLQYLTGLNAEGVLLLAPRENVFITDSRYIEQVNNSLTIDSEIVACDAKHMNKYDYESYFSMCNNIGFEEKYVTYEKYKQYLQMFQVNLVETEGIIESQRIVKEDYEIEKIKKACDITDKAFEFIKNNIEVGMTEREIAFKLDNYMITHGADGLAFETIVASGENSSMPHAVPTDRKIEEKDIILFDFGARVDGYCADCSRTIFVGGVTEEQEKIYKFVLEEQRKIIQNFREGTNIKNIIRNREEDFKIEKYDVLHAFGHGIGLEVHEDPILRSKIDNSLKRYSVVAIEPGVYLPRKFGIRIEDTCLIEKNACIELTHSDKTITIIEER